MPYAYRLALTRVVACAALLIESLIENASALTWLPASMRVSMGAMRFIPEIYTHNLTIWTAFDILVPLALLVALLGYRTRWSLLIAAAAYFVEGGLLRSHSFFFHNGLVPLQVVALLALTPCGDVLSLDARWKRTRLKSEDVYRWALLVVWMPLALTYLMAGLNKVRYGGLDWFAPNTLRGHSELMKVVPLLPTSDLRPWINLIPPFAWSLMALFTVFTEVGYVTVLWSRRARYLFPVLAAAMHLGIWLVMGHAFPDLIVLQLAVFPVEVLWRADTSFSRFLSRRFSLSSG